jgi:hypothetical protein
MTRLDKESRVDRRPQIIVRGKIEPRSVAPIECLRRVLNGKQFDAIDAESCNIIQVLEDKLVERPELDERILRRIARHPLDRHLVDDNFIV